MCVRKVLNPSTLLVELGWDHRNGAAICSAPGSWGVQEGEEDARIAHHSLINPQPSPLTHPTGLLPHRRILLAAPRCSRERGWCLTYRGLLTSPAERSAVRALPALWCVPFAR